MTDISFKEFCDEYIKKVSEGYNPRNHREFFKEAEKKFGVVEKTVRKRIKSFYGKNLTEMVKINRMPSKEKALCALIESENTKEFWDKLGLPHYLRRGFYDKYFGVSTFERAKGKILLETYTNNYKPSISSNKSLVVSQLLGDGSYCSKRGSFRLSHGENQLEYAVWKASLFNKAFPTTKPAGSTRLLTHTQGHKYSIWCSGRLPSKITSWVERTPIESMVEHLDPFGMLLYFLDDGYINLDTTKRGNSYVEIYVHNDKVLESLVAELLSYGIRGTTSRNVFKIGTIEGAVKFYKCFIEPYIQDIPECMQYKLLLKI